MASKTPLVLALQYCTLSPGLATRQEKGSTSVSFTLEEGESQVLLAHPAFSFWSWKFARSQSSPPRLGMWRSATSCECGVVSEPGFQQGDPEPMSRRLGTARV